VRRDAAERRRLVAEGRRGGAEGPSIDPPRRAPRQQLVREHAPRELIGPAVERLAADLLRRHVQRRADLRPVSGEGRQPARARVDLGRRARIDAVRAEPLGDPEVEHLGRTVRAHDDVLGLHVAVHDVLGVRGVERAGDLVEPAQLVVEGAAAVADLLAQRLALHQLHHDVRPELCVLGDVVERDGVRVRQPSVRARFAQHPRLGLVGGVAIEEDLHRDVPVEPGVAGAVDAPHAPLAQQARDLEPIEPVTRREGRRPVAHAGRLRP
jgi:hypothetical protein